MAKVTMPQLGESVAEGTIGKWLKQPGDTVAKYEPLLEVITDKVNAEVPSPFAGVLRQILVEEGATVPNNAEIAIIETEEEAAGGGLAASAPAPAAAGATGPVVVSTPAAAPAATPAAPAAAPVAPAVAATAASNGSQSPAPAAERPAAAATGSAPVATAPAAPPAVAAAAPAASSAAANATSPESDARMTPAVRRLLREHGLSAAVVTGSGAGGRITREDVTNYVESVRTGQSVGGQVVRDGASIPGLASATVPEAAPEPSAPSASTVAAPAPTAAAPAPAAAPASGSTPSRGIPGQQVSFPDGADEVLLPMTQMRKGIAAQMTRALQVPHAYVQVEVDATRLVRLRDSQKREFAVREGTSLSFVPFVVKAVVHALKRNPAFNAHWTEQGLLAKRRINMGVAVAVSDGLIVPVVHDVDLLSIAGINRAIAEVAARARAKKLRLEDLQGSTFTIDNTGWFGSNITLPIINVPEVAILTMENITKRPVVVETADGDVIAIRPVMNMVIGIDHRANDGAQAAAFLNDIKGWLETIDADLPLW